MPEVIGEAELTCEAINEAVSEPLRTTVRLEVRETRKMKLEELSEVKKYAKNMSEVRLKLEEFQKAEWKSVKTVHEDSMELEDFLEDREVRERLVSGPSLAGAVLSSKMHQAPTLSSEGRGWNSSQSFQGRGWEAGERLERSKSRQSSLPILEEEEDRRKSRRGQSSLNNLLSRKEKRIMMMEEEEKVEEKEEEEEMVDYEYDYSHFEYVNQLMNESFKETLLESGGYDDDEEEEEYPYSEVSPCLFFKYNDLLYYYFNFLIRLVWSKCFTPDITVLISAPKSRDKKPSLQEIVPVIMRTYCIYFLKQFATIQD